MIGIILGSCGSQIAFREKRRDTVDTPYGPADSPLLTGELHQHELVVLFRHGLPHTLAPHRINYRANIWALEKLGVDRIVALNTVGGITPEMPPGTIVFPDQLIDYTYSREATFFDGGEADLAHIDFSRPYDPELHLALIDAARAGGLRAVRQGIYGITQGPRLETVAEVDRLARDGCNIVGMTGMPEAALARERGLRYVCCGLVVNWAAGRGPEEDVHSQIERFQRDALQKADQLLGHALDRI